MNEQYTTQEKLELLIKRDENPKELRDYSSKKHGERYQEFRDEHLKTIIDTLNNRYSSYSLDLEKEIINYSDCTFFVCLPLVLIIGCLIDIPAPTWKAILISLLVLVLLIYGYSVISNYKEKSIKALYKQYERKRIIADYVRREEDYIISKLMNNRTIDPIYRESQYYNIKEFFKYCLEELQGAKFTDERY